MVNNLEGMPEKFRIELESMSNLYGSIQDLRVLKDNYDALLLNQFRRNTVGRIQEHYDWSTVANYMIHELNKKSPSVGDSFSIDISSLAALKNSNESTVDCGLVSSVPTIEKSKWILTFLEAQYSV